MTNNNLHLTSSGLVVTRRVTPETLRAVTPAPVTFDIGVDIDGVMYRFAALYRARYALEKGIPLDSLPEPTTWYFNKQWGLPTTEFLELFAAWVNDGYLFRVGEPEPGSVEGLQLLAAAGHRIHLITARAIKGAEDAAIESTAWWLDEHGLPYHSLTISDDKTCRHTDVFIEDCAANYADLHRAGYHPVLMNRPWNRAEELSEDPFFAEHTPRRVDDMIGFADYVSQLAEEAAA